VPNGTATQEGPIHATESDDDSSVEGNDGTLCERGGGYSDGSEESQPSSDTGDTDEARVKDSVTTKNLRTSVPQDKLATERTTTNMEVEKDCESGGPLHNNSSLIEQIPSKPDHSITSARRSVYEKLASVKRVMESADMALRSFAATLHGPCLESGSLNKAGSIELRQPLCAKCLYSASPRVDLSWGADTTAAIIGSSGDPEAPIDASRASTVGQRRCTLSWFSYH